MLDFQLLSLFLAFRYMNRDRVHICLNIIGSKHHGAPCWLGAKACSEVWNSNEGI